jgi:hypothetical protein
MKTYANSRILVTIPNALSAEFGDDRGKILSRAMNIISHRAEAIRVAAERIDERSVAARAQEILVRRFLSEPGKCRCDVNITMLRAQMGRAMSEGMAADYAAAVGYAQNALANETDEAAAALAAARLQAESVRTREVEYHNRRSAGAWEITVIGEGRREFDSNGNCIAHTQSGDPEHPRSWRRADLIEEEGVADGTVV